MKEVENFFDKIVSGNNYEVDTVCGNCGLKQKTKIKKGNKAADVIHKGKCENCGVQELSIKK